VSAASVKALLRNAGWRTSSEEAKQFGISGEATFDYGVAFDRSRKVAEGRVAGVHFLMKKNKITEIHGCSVHRPLWSVERSGARRSPSPSSSPPAAAPDWCREPRCRTTWSRMKS
jgi:hypothetical protein